jgi:hypothetical protein
MPVQRLSDVPICSTAGHDLISFVKHQTSELAERERLDENAVNDVTSKYSRGSLNVGNLSHIK